MCADKLVLLFVQVLGLQVAFLFHEWAMRLKKLCYVLQKLRCAYETNGVAFTHREKTWRCVYKEKWRCVYDKITMRL